MQESGQVETLRRDTQSRAAPATRLLPAGGARKRGREGREAQPVLPEHTPLH